MPELSRFFGIIIRMYAEVNAPHHEPHFHAYYQDEVAIFALDPIELIAGHLPRRQHVWLKGRLSYIKWSCWQIGICCSRVRGRFPYSRLSRGRFMNHAIHQVSSFEILAPYTLRVLFDDDTQQTIDFEPVLAGELFRPLLDLALFNEVRIDREVHTLVWPNGADFDPETLHNWPRYRDALIERARRWELVPA